MNKLPATIINIESSPHMSLVKAQVPSGDVFTAIVLEVPADSPRLRVGAPVHVLFKETEVAIAKNLSGKISLRNRFKSKIRALTKDRLLTRVTLEHPGGAIVSIISTAASDDMTLAEGDPVEWLVKSNEITLSWEGKA